MPQKCKYTTVLCPFSFKRT